MPMSREHGLISCLCAVCVPVTVYKIFKKSMNYTDYHSMQVKWVTHRLQVFFFFFSFLNWCYMTKEKKKGGCGIPFCQKGTGKLNPLIKHCTVNAKVWYVFFHKSPVCVKSLMDDAFYVILLTNKGVYLGAGNTKQQHTLLIYMYYLHCNNNTKLDENQQNYHWSWIRIGKKKALRKKKKKTLDILIFYKPAVNSYTHYESMNI